MRETVIALAVLVTLAALASADDKSICDRTNVEKKLKSDSSTLSSLVEDGKIPDSKYIKGVLGMIAENEPLCGKNDWFNKLVDSIKAMIEQLLAAQAGGPPDIPDTK